MRFIFIIVFITIFVTSQAVFASAPAETKKIFLLEDDESGQWCIYTNEKKWNKEVQDAQSSTVGTLIYSNGILTQIYVTETDESGDWTVYDHYFLNNQGKVMRLSRLINTLTENLSVLKTYMMKDGKLNLSETMVKDLVTKKPVTSRKPDWLPDLDVRTAINEFPFFRLIERVDLKLGNESCG